MTGVSAQIQMLLNRGVKIVAPASRAPRAAATSRWCRASERGRSRSPLAWIIRTATVLASSGSPDRSAWARTCAKERR